MAREPGILVSGPPADAADCVDTLNHEGTLWIQLSLWRYCRWRAAPAAWRDNRIDSFASARLVCPVDWPTVHGGKNTMSQVSSPEQTCLKDSFTWSERLLLRGLLAAMLGIGVYGIYPHRPAAAAAYLAFAAIGGLLVIYDFLCVYCPYPFDRSSCLFFPPPLLTAVANRRHGRIHWLRKAGLLLVGAGLVVIPQYWLWGNWGPFAAFWIVTIPLGLVFPLYYCKRCRHARCPFQSAPPSSG